MDISADAVDIVIETDIVALSAALCNRASRDSRAIVEGTPKAQSLKADPPAPPDILWPMRPMKE